MLTMVVSGNILLIGLMIFIKWTVLVSQKAAPKICMDVKEPRAEEYMSERTRIIILTYFPYFFHMC